MRVQVLLFGLLKDRLKQNSIVVEINGESNVQTLLESCATQYPDLTPWLPFVRVAVDCEYAAPETIIAANSEVALLPPVAGG
jgi:molybdopterin converting factor small subunit